MEAQIGSILKETDIVRYQDVYGRVKNQMKKNNFKSTFGSFIREQRIELEVGQRELAGKLGIAASYLNDIEKNKRKAPKQIIIKKISKVLKINLEDLNDLAGISKGNVAPDIGEYIENNPGIVSLIRSIKENNLDEEQIEKIENSLNKNNNLSLIHI